MSGDNPWGPDGPPPSPHNPWEKPIPPPTVLPISPSTTNSTRQDGFTGTTEPQGTDKAGDASTTLPPPPQPDPEDMREPHTWRNQRQPPIGARVQQILIFLSDEDIDRRRDWARELDEAEAWVNDMLAARDENRLGDQTIALLRQAAAAIATHRHNEAFHYRTFMPLKIPRPEDMPTYKPRLPYYGEDPVQFGVAGPKGKTANILPMLPEVPRPWARVNNLWLTQRETDLGLTPTAQRAGVQQLARDEDLLLPLRADEPQTMDNNTAVLENKNFQINTRQKSGVNGWTFYHNNDPTDNTKTTGRSTTGSLGRRIMHPNGAGARRNPLMETGDGASVRYYAAERGARRAGLQAALRSFHSAENHMVADTGHMLVLPGGTLASTAQDLDEVRRKAGIGSARPIRLPELPANQLQRVGGKTDPQGFISNMAQFWKNSHKADEWAHAFAMRAQFGTSADGPLFPNKLDRRKPLLPESTFGPFVWRGVPAYVQLRQDLLRQMQGLKRLFDHEQKVAPRDLLAMMTTAYNQGYNREQPGDFVKLDKVRDIKPADFTHSPVRGEDGQASSAAVRGDEEFPLPNTFLLEKVEMEWIRFLLNNSMTKGMTVEALPRTTLFLVFAERLSRIFNDPGDSLFPDKDTSVSIEDLIAHMANMKGPVKKTTFYPYDVKMFLERLAHQGRCRYTEDWRTYGQVRRPLLNYFPEHLVIWKPRDAADADTANFIEDSIPKTPRFTDRRTWLDIMANSPPGNTLDTHVEQYFTCLAYKWGRSVDQLESSQASWIREDPLPVRAAVPGVESLERGYRTYLRKEVAAAASRPGFSAFLAATGENTTHIDPQNHLLRLWRATTHAGPTATPPADGSSRKSGIQRTIQKNVLDEVVRADNMLYPGRTTDYTNPLAPMTRESIWDWAKPAVRGKTKQYFGLDRWPLELQTAETQARIKDDVDVDTEMLWNPIVEDPTPWTYYRPKARPYGEERVKFRAGQRLFPIGDTARQREVVKNQVITMVGRAMGIVPMADDRDIWPIRFAKRVLGLKRSRPIDNPDDDPDDPDVAHRHKLPRIDPKLYPPRIDRVADAERRKREYEEATRPTVVPEDQVPGDAEDGNVDRVPTDAPGALFREQNRRLGRAW